MIVGLCGYARTGKNTLADLLEEYEQVAFADALKEEVTRMLAAVGIRANVWGADKEQWRDLLVFWGRERRKQDKDYWIKQLYMKIAPLADKRIVITDVRYLNELEWITKQKGLVVGIKRPGCSAANEEERLSITAIEMGFNDVKIPWIKNDGTPEQMEKVFRATVKQLRSA